MHCNSIIKTLFCLTLIFVIGCDQSDDKKIEQAMKQIQADRQARSNTVARAVDSLGDVRNNSSQTKDRSESQPLGFRELKSLLPENLSDMNRAKLNDVDLEKLKSMSKAGQ